MNSSIKIFSIVAVVALFSTAPVGMNATTAYAAKACKITFKAGQAHLVFRSGKACKVGGNKACFKAWKTGDDSKPVAFKRSSGATNFVTAGKKIVDANGSKVGTLRSGCTGKILKGQV